MTINWKVKQMQASDADNNTQRFRDGELISSFRPSQSFIHIKYLKSKIDEANTAKSENDVAESTASPGQEAPERVNSANPTQPPLPPNSPPPDIPLEVTIKQEVLEECNHSSENMSDANHPSDSVTELNQSSVEQSTEMPKKTMCRNFVRGTCTRGAACIFSHKLDISQLKGVYTFCKNFQNRVCTLPTCKFVHATVFEKENFFRTGYLPPHTLSHLKQVQLPPPPPPPEEPPASPPQKIFTNHPAVSLNNGVSPILTTVPILTCQRPISMEPRAEPLYTAPTITSTFLNTAVTHTITSASAAMPSNSCRKRNWSTMGNFSSTPQDFDVGEPVLKKCKHCDYNEFRLRYNKAKVKVMESSMEKVKKKLATLDKMNNKLYACLMTLSEGGNMFEEVSKLLNNRTAPTLATPVLAQEDSAKDLLDGLLKSLLFSGAMQTDSS